MKNKTTINFYRSWFGKFELRLLLPRIVFSRNVQGYCFTRNYTICWLVYACTLSRMVYDNTDMVRGAAHSVNVSKYLRDTGWYSEVVKNKEDYPEIMKVLRKHWVSFKKDDVCRSYNVPTDDSGRCGISVYPPRGAGVSKWVVLCHDLGGATDVWTAEQMEEAIKFYLDKLRKQ